MRLTWGVWALQRKRVRKRLCTLSRAISLRAGPSVETLSQTTTIRLSLTLEGKRWRLQSEVRPPLRWKSTISQRHLPWLITCISRSPAKMSQTSNASRSNQCSRWPFPMMNRCLHQRRNLVQSRTSKILTQCNSATESQQSLRWVATCHSERTRITSSSALSLLSSEKRS